jgi:hypothetical protein
VTELQFFCSVDAHTKSATMQPLAFKDTEVHLDVLPCSESLRLHGPPGLFVAEPPPPSHEPGQWPGSCAPISPLSPRELFAISEVDPALSVAAPPNCVPGFPGEAAWAPRRIEEPDPPRHEPGQFDARFTPRAGGGSVTPSPTPREFFSMSTPPSSPRSRSNRGFDTEGLHAPV